MKEIQCILQVRTIIVIAEIRADNYLGLSDFVVMVRKLEVNTTSVNVHRRTENTASHYRAFDVPARPTLDRQTDSDVTDTHYQPKVQYP